MSVGAPLLEGSMRWGRWLMSLRTREDERVPEYHADLYREDGYDDTAEVAEAFCYFGPTHLGLTLGLDGMEHRYSIHLGLPRATFGWRGGRPRHPSREREYGIKYHTGTLYLLGGRSPDGWSRGQPWWWEQTVDLTRLIFGRVRHESRELETREFSVYIEAENYRLTVTLSEARWRSNRPILGRFVSETIRRAEVEPDRPVPIPGKGENSHDRDDDAVYSLTTPAETTGKAVGEFIQDIIETRWRYGGEGWTPALKGEG